VVTAVSTKRTLFNASGQTMYEHFIETGAAARLLPAPEVQQ
jgi:hypothetical protein